MRVRTVVVLVAVLCLVGGAGWAASRPRPSLLITKQHVANAKRLIDAQLWAARLYEEVRLAAKEGSTVARGIVYQIEDDKEMAAQAKASLIEGAARFTPGGNTYHWGMGVERAITYDLIAEACTPEEQKTIEDYLRRVAKDAIEWKNGTGGTPNMSSVCYYSVGVTGYAIGDQEVIDWALHDDHRGRPMIGGLFPTMESGLRDNCLWHEAPIYGNLVFCGWLMMAEAAKNSQGVDLYNM
ncbi:MAG: hypothetical protein KAX78_03505, partial [Phycisphaerae bacterium]|nr:hypothetical protein [Phycisphaerae bacterium]